MRHVYLREYIPQTEPFTLEALTSMLGQYGMVYVKPDTGTFGSGVIRVETAEGGYTAQLGTQLYRYPSTGQLHEGLLQLKSKGRYVIQRGIELLRHRNRRFDVRVMVQQNPRGRWETTGIIGRLSHPKRIVTNYHSGGTPTPFQALASDHLDTDGQREYMRKLRVLGTTVAAQLATQYPRLREIGIDVAIDTALQPWILEVNTLPDPFIFKRLKVKSVFRKMYRYAQAYGRFRSMSAQERGPAVSRGRRTAGRYKKTARHQSR